MIIDTKFTVGNEVYFMLSNRIESGVIKEIEIHISPRWAVSPTVIYKLTNGVHIVNPPILCATREDVADVLLNNEPKE